MRRFHLAAAAVAVLIVLAGCTATAPGAASQPTTAGSVRVHAQRTTTLAITGAWQVRVPPGAAPDGARLSATAEPTVQAALTPPSGAGLQLLQDAQVSLSSGEPVRPFAFTYRLAQPLPAGAALFMVDEEESAGAVLAAAQGSGTPVPVTAHPGQMSADRRTATFTLDHLSNLTVWLANAAGAGQAGLGKLLGQRAAAPTCSSVPTWMNQAPVFLDDQNAPMRVCVGRDDNHPDTAEVKIVNNRGGFERITAGAPAAWVYQSVFGSTDPESWANGLAAQVLRTAFGVPPTELSRTWLVPPGGELDLGFTQQTVTSADPLTISGHLPLAGAVAGFAETMLNFLEPSNSALKFGLFLACTIHGLSPISETFTTADVTEAAVAMIRCAMGDPEQIVTQVKSQLAEARNAPEVIQQVGSALSGELSKVTAASKAIGRVALILDIGEAAFDGLDLSFTLATNSTAGDWTITVYPPLARRAPTPSGVWTSPSLTFTASSLGAVSLGMPAATAEQAAGIGFDGEGDGAYYPTTLPPGFAHLYVRGDPVSCIGAQQGAGDGAQTISANGIRLGDSGSRVPQVYGANAQYVPAPPDGMAPEAGYVVQLGNSSLAFQVSGGPSGPITGITLGGADLTPSDCPG